MDAIILLIFLFILAIGIGVILYVCAKYATPTTKETHNFWVMGSWALGIYLFLAFFVLLGIIDTVSK